MLTDNHVLVDNLRELPALMCVQRKAKKKVITEPDLISANIASFGADIGKITNRITAMFDVQSTFPPDSDEYKILDYRIKCGQLYQQNSIDKAKGIIAKPMPREWFDKHVAASIIDDKTRELYMAILADRKPYFMRYIYPDLMRQYNSHIKKANRKSSIMFSASVNELLSRDSDTLSEDELNFIKFYKQLMPVSDNGCVVNRICRLLERAFDGGAYKTIKAEDFSSDVLKVGCGYTRTYFTSVESLITEYGEKISNKVGRECSLSAKGMPSQDEPDPIEALRSELLAKCLMVCNNESMLCDIVLDVCYGKSRHKALAWSVFGDVIVTGLLNKCGYKIQLPVADRDGDITYSGETFLMKEFEVDIE